MDRVGSEKVRLDDSDKTVSFARHDVELNLGGIGKGYALDRATALLSSEVVGNFLFHGGRSSVLARGSRSASGAEDPWAVGIAHPVRPERRLGLLTLRDQAMSTSGTATQSFHHQGKRYGHILDPRTGQPATGVLSATAVCDDAATADALSTAFYVMGAERTEAFCQRNPEAAALIVLPTKNPQQVEVACINMPEDAWQAL